MLYQILHISIPNRIIHHVRILLLKYFYQYNIINHILATAGWAGLVVSECTQNRFGVSGVWQL